MFFSIAHIQLQHSRESIFTSIKASVGINDLEDRAVFWARQMVVLLNTEVLLEQTVLFAFYFYLFSSFINLHLWQSFTKFWGLLGGFFMHKTVKSKKLPYPILEHSKGDRLIQTSHILPVPSRIFTKGLGKWLFK